jgi:hypothetical protein
MNLRGISRGFQTGYDTMDRAMETRDRDRLRKELGEAGKADQVEGIGNVRQNPDAPYVEGQEEGPQYTYDKNFQLGGQTQATRFTPDQVNQYRMDRMSDVYARNGRADEAVKMRGAAQQSRAAGLQLEQGQRQQRLQGQEDSLREAYQRFVQNPNDPANFGFLMQGLAAYNKAGPGSKYNDGKFGGFDPEAREFTLVNPDGSVRRIPMEAMPPEHLMGIARHGYMAQLEAVNPQLAAQMMQTDIQHRGAATAEGGLAETTRNNTNRYNLGRDELNLTGELGRGRLELQGRQVENEGQYQQGMLGIQRGRLAIAGQQASAERWQLVGYDSDRAPIMMDARSGNMKRSDGKPVSDAAAMTIMQRVQGGRGAGAGGVGGENRYLGDGNRRVVNGQLQELSPDGRSWMPLGEGTATSRALGGLQPGADPFAVDEPSAAADPLPPTPGRTRTLGLSRQGEINLQFPDFNSGLGTSRTLGNTWREPVNPTQR